MASKIREKSSQVGPSWTQVGPTWVQVQPSCRVRCKPWCTSSQDVVPMRFWSATWPNITPTWPENSPKMEARGGPTCVFSVFFRSWRLLAAKRAQEEARRAQESSNSEFWLDLGAFVGKIWKNFGVVLGGSWLVMKQIVWPGRFCCCADNPRSPEVVP